MYRIGVSGVLALGLFALNAGCKTRQFSDSSASRGLSTSAAATQASANLLPGVPMPDLFLQGVVDDSFDKLFILDESNKVLHRISLNNGTLQKKGGNNSIGVVGIPDYFGSFSSQTLTTSKGENCGKLVEELSGRTDLVPSGNAQICTFQLHSTANVIVGNSNVTGVDRQALDAVWNNTAIVPVPNGKYWGFAISIIPVTKYSADGAGTDAYDPSIYEAFLKSQALPSGGNKWDAVNGLKSSLGDFAKAAANKREIKDGEIPLFSVGTGIDVQAVANEIVKAAEQFNPQVDEGTRNSCLQNYRAKDWTDLGAHYYCQLPYEYRECFSGALITGRAKLEAGSATDTTLTPEKKASNRLEGVKKLYSNSWESCKGKGGTAKWLASNQENFFKFAVFSLQTYADFNLDQENEAINMAYAKLNNTKRPRRALDTYKEWDATQPRYDKIRGLQLENLKKFGKIP